MSTPPDERSDGREPPSVRDAGPVAYGGDVRVTGGIAAGRDVNMHGPVNVFADDGAPYGDAVARPGGPGDTCPYPGLGAFGGDFVPYFHGRAADVDAVLELLRGASLVAVIGSSGSGKSSLLSAGVLPALAKGWVPLTIRPGTRPDPGSLCGFDDQDGQTLLVVDQLEEVFHPAVDDATRAAFLAALSALTRAAGTKVIIALRADFYPHLEQEPELAVAVAAAQHRLLPLGRQAIRDVIEKPAEQVGLRVEPALVDQILIDIGTADSVLPLLSYALEQTWRRRRRDWLTLAGYVDAGALNGAIDRAADVVWDSLGERQRATARRVMLRLSHLGEGSVAVRRQARLEDLVTDVDDEATVREVVDRLAAARIVTVDVDGTGAPTVDLMHEAVLRAWSRLRNWLSDDREVKRAQDDLSNGAVAWRRHGTDAGYLLRGARLAAVESARRGNGLTVNGLESRFLTLSRRLERRQRLRSRLLGVLAACLVVAVAVSLVVLGQQRRISHEKTVADAVALAAQSRSIAPRQRDLGALLAVAGARTNDNAETRSAVMDAVSARSGPLAYLLPADQHATTMAGALTQDGSAIVGTVDGSIAVVSAADGHATAPSLTGHKANITAVTLAGDLVLSGDAAGLVTVHKIGAAEPTHRPVTATSAVVAIAYSSVRREVFVATTFGGVARWKLSDRLVPLPQLPHSPEVVDLAVDDAVDQLVAVNSAGSLLRWRLSSGAELPVLAEEGGLGTGTTMRLATTTANRLLTVDENHIGVWDLRGTKPPLWTDRSGGTAVTRNHNGDVFVGTDSGSITTWRLAPGPLGVEPVRFGLGPPVVALAANDTFLVGADQAGRAMSWDITGLRSPAATPAVDTGGIVQTVAESSRGEIASAGADGVVRVSTKGVTTEVHAFADSVVGQVWTPGGSIVAGTVDGSVSEIDPTTGEVRTILRRPGTSVVAVATDHRGTVAVAYADGHVFLPDRPDVVIPAAPAPITSLAVDGTRLAIGSGDGVAAPPQITVRTGDGFGGAHTLRGHALPVTALAFSPDGQHLASGSDDRTIRLWSLADNTTVTELHGHNDMVLALAYTPDGRTLASGSQDGTIRFWDTDRGAQIGQPVQFGDEFVWSLAASPDGHTLAAAQGGTVVEWPFTPQAWIDRACGMARRDLTSDERRRLLPASAPHTICADSHTR